MRFGLHYHNMTSLLTAALLAATTASSMTAKNLSNDIKGVNDLAGKTVQTWEGYMSSLR
jgi:hypothetical protein